MLLLAAAGDATALDAEAAKDTDLSRLANMSLEELMKTKVTTVAGTPSSRISTPAALTVLTAEDIRRSGARMLPFWFHRAEDGRYHLRIEAAWPAWLDAPPAESAAIYMRELEHVVRKHPAQYLWVHRRFKTRPPGEPSVYD